MSKEKIEMSVELNGQEVVAYPYVNSDHVLLDNNMTIDKMLESDVVEPVITHEEVSFKVGQGDSDLSDSIVDSSAGGFTIKGQTYQNILPEPSTHVLSNNKEMFKVNEGLDPNVEIVDGVSKSAILKGNTLVNLIKNGYTPSSTLNKENGTASIIPLDNSKEYTLMLNKNLAQVNIRFWYTDGSYGNDYAFSSRDISGYVKDKLQINRANATGKTLENIQIYSVDANGEITNIMLLEGDYTNVDIPYFEGMQSVKLPVLTTTGKNLIIPFTSMKQSAVNGMTISENEIIGIPTNKGFNLMQDIYLEKDITYTLSFEIRDGLSNRVRIKDGDSLVVTNIQNSFTVPKTKMYTIVFENNANIENELHFKHPQLEYNSTATSYEPYKSNILSTSEDVTLRGIGDVQDTLDCLTGEVSQNLIEFEFNDGNYFSNNFIEYDNTIRWQTVTSIRQLLQLKTGGKIYSSNFINDNSNNDYEHIRVDGSTPYGNVVIYLSKTKASTHEELKTYLKNNPFTIVAEKAEKSIKTVDLSSSGNWEKIVLDGSEKWTNCTDLGNGYYRFQRGLGIFNNPYKDANNMGRGFSDTVRWDANWTDQSEGFYYDSVLVFRIHHSKLPSLSNEGFEQFLSQNPITVWYQTATHQESTQVKQPIFFKDGHIIQSSGADSSLIPTLDYQAKTSNSYVMDLMKTNTRYTMKAKSASGTFTIDGTSYNVGTNTTFTSPTSMTNKLLVMSNKTNEEVMILEGDVTDKTIPYFKGIKSAFEDEDKIEVLSTGKNLFDGKWVCGQWINVDNGIQEPLANRACVENYIQVKPSTNYAYNFTYESNEEINGRAICLYDIDKQFIGATSTYKVKSIFTTPNNAHYIKYSVYTTSNAPLSKQDVETFKFQIEESPTQTSYEPYKSNSTKIPLLSPLRSLPNGVHDEIVLDRERNKAQIIQRVGKVTYDGTDVWGTHTVHDNNVRIQTTLPNCVRRDTAGFIYAICDKLPSVIWNYSWLQNYNLVTINLTNLYLQLSDTTMTKQQMLSWLTQNPITVQYELAEPVVTEVDLEGFPYVYKDGHIFLNSEIAPVTEIKYSINQQQQIESSSQDLIRHQKEIDYLYKLIGEYVRVDYKNTLLSLNLELK